VLGRFFHDHISAPMARIKVNQARRLNRMAGFRFAGTTMRSLRFELSPGAQKRERVASTFGHISVEADDSAGYEALRLFLRSLQQTGRIRPDLARRLLTDIPYLAKAGYWRYVRHQLYWPPSARHELHVVVEQAPNRDNRIALAGENDPFGLPLAAINWRVGQLECDTFAAYLRRFDAFWKRRDLAAIGEVEWSVRADALSVADISHGGDVFHPGGSTRMGGEGRSAVVGPNLRTHALSNLWVASTSVFPSTASANPTLTLMLLTLRLADHLGQLLGKA
jgi:choline dehydrogenase-like flavoprotein